MSIFSATVHGSAQSLGLSWARIWLASMYVRAALYVSSEYHFFFDARVLMFRSNLIKRIISMAKKILVVEDDFDTRYILSLIFKTEGYEVITAADGECALAVAGEQRP